MRILVAILIFIQFSAGSVFAQVLEGPWVSEMTSATESGCNPACPDDDQNDV